MGVKMAESKASLLIVDDEQMIRSSLSHALTDMGYQVRTAEDGFSALRELRKEIPGIILSDLNMPGMSGFELLSIVRRRFPEVHAIAMSGAFSGDEVPNGVAADAFFQKGSSVGCLLRILESVPLRERPPSRHTWAPAPVWIDRGALTLALEGWETVQCPECLRISPLPLGDPNHPVRAKACIHCQALIQVDPIERAFMGNPAQGKPEPANAAQCYL
jgi:CheY-like chemotaxis protein